MVKCQEFSTSFKLVAGSRLDSHNLKIPEHAQEPLDECRSSAISPVFDWRFLTKGFIKRLIEKIDKKLKEKSECSCDCKCKNK